MKESRLEDMSGSSVEQSRLLDCGREMKSLNGISTPFLYENGLRARASADNKSLGNVLLSQIDELWGISYDI